MLCVAIDGEFFDPLDQCLQVGTCEAHARRRNAIMPDVRRNVFVMWVCAFEFRVIWVWLGIVRGEFACFVP